MGDEKRRHIIGVRIMPMGDLVFAGEVLPRSHRIKLFGYCPTCGKRLTLRWGDATHSYIVAFDEPCVPES